MPLLRCQISCVELLRETKGGFLFSVPALARSADLTVSVHMSDLEGTLFRFICILPIAIARRSKASALTCWRYEFADLYLRTVLSVHLTHTQTVRSVVRVVSVKHMDIVVIVISVLVFLHFCSVCNVSLTEIESHIPLLSIRKRQNCLMYFFQRYKFRFTPQKAAQLSMFCCSDAFYKQ